MSKFYSRFQIMDIRYCNDIFRDIMEFYLTRVEKEKKVKKKVLNENDDDDDENGVCKINHLIVAASKL